MQNIEPLTTKQGIKIWFTYPFNWKYPEICKRNKLKWNPKEKKWSLEFTNALLPLSGERVVQNHKEVFDLFEKSVVKIFVVIFNNLLKLKLNKPIILTERLDLRDYGDLYQHQRVGVQLLQDMSGLAILADEQGLGKTKTTCIWLLHNNLTKVLFVSPCTARSIWKNELITLGVPDDFINIVDQKTKLTGGFDIINYEKLKKYHKDLIKQKYECIILDEAHKITNRQSQRFKYAFEVSKKIPKCICVTGTPVGNRPEELFALLRIIKSPLSTNFSNFADRYCDRKLVSHGIGQHYDTSGASNLDELGQKLKNHMIRRLKSNCLDIPDKTHHIFKLTLPAAGQKKYDGVLDGLHKHVKINGKSKKILPFVIQQLSFLRQICAEQKINNVRSFIKDYLESDQKLIIFGCFNSVLTQLYNENSAHSVMITGDTPQEEREFIEKDFQINPKKKIFFGNIKAAGVALTLTAASTILFIDLSWNPQDHNQAEDRIHRIGTASDSEPNIYYLIFRDTIEEDIHGLLMRKQTMIDTILSASEVAYNQKSVLQNLIQKYQT